MLLLLCLEKVINEPGDQETKSLFLKNQKPAANRASTTKKKIILFDENAYS